MDSKTSVVMVMGPMFAGKSSWIVQYVRSKQAVGLAGIIVKPSWASSRQSVENEALISTHDEVTAPCILWPSEDSLANFFVRLEDDTKLEQVHEQVQKRPTFSNVSFIVIDEAQFAYGHSEFIQECERRGISVVLVGLNGTFDRKPFVVHGESWLSCASFADEIIFLKAMCTRCRNGNHGIFTHRKLNSNDMVLVGSSDTQETLCRSCFIQFN